MTLIDKIIKILINFKYKKKPFMAWCWGIDEIHEINILTAEYYQDHYRYGTREEYYKADTEFNHEAFYEFLLNVINLNEIEKYRSMFLSSGEIVNGE